MKILEIQKVSQRKTKNTEAKKFLVVLTDEKCVGLKSEYGYFHLYVTPTTARKLAEKLNEMADKAEAKE